MLFDSARVMISVRSGLGRIAPVGLLGREFDGLPVVEG